MKITRRDLIKGAGATMLIAGMPFYLKKPVKAQGWNATQPIWAIKHFGTDIKFWCFDKSSRVRKSQILQVKRWGFDKLRDNNPEGFTDTDYDIYHAAATAQDCLDHGVEFLITGSDRNIGLENFVTPQQYQAILQKYNGDVDYARRVINTIGTGLNIEPIRNFLLEKIQWYRNVFPQGVRMQCWNGPEMDGFIAWNMYDPGFQDWVKSIGFSFDSVGGGSLGQGENANTTIKQHFDSFRLQAKAIWGEPWLEQNSMHLYWYESDVYGNQIFFTPWQPELWQPNVTEYGVNYYDVPNRKQALQNYLFIVIQKMADHGMEFTFPDGKWNLREVFLHEAVDQRWVDLWVKGDTSPLWSPRTYQRLLAKETTDRKNWAEYSGTLMELGCAAAMTQVISALKKNNTFAGMTEKEAIAYVFSDSMDFPETKAA